MLCPRCAKTSTKREREGGACPGCKRVFVFDPPAPISDYEIDKAIKALSRNGAHKFTKDELVAEIERHIVAYEQKALDTELAGIDENTPIPFLVAAAGLGGIALAFAVEFPPTGVFGLIAVVGAVWRLATRGKPEDRRQVVRDKKAALTGDARARGIVDRFVAMDRPPALLPDDLAHAEASYRKRAREFDLESFGFDRVVVVQHDQLVDMLVANRFHFDHNAAVVSMSGYPKHVAEIVRKQMESGHTKAHVFLVHDASTEGYAAAEGWRRSAWAERATIVRVGLTPKQVKDVLPRGPGHAGAPPSASREDADWLAEHRVSLHALRPLQLMTLVFNAITAVDKAEASQTSTHTQDGGFFFVGFDSVSDTSFDFG